jgi:hypothetical protein
MLEEQDWNMDVFYIDSITNHHSLLFITFALFERYKFLDLFHIPQYKFINFIKAIEQQYLDNPYHNSMHATEVLWSTHYLCVTNKIEQQLTDLEFMCLLLSAICHDVSHRGNKITNTLKIIFITNNQYNIFFIFYR